MATFSTVVQADIYKCADSSGHVTYTNDKPPVSQKNCSLLTRELPVNTVSMPKRSAATPSDFPKVDDATQKSRDSERRKILEQELSTEQSALDDAKKELAAQEAVRNGDERNYQKYLDRIQPFKDKADLHERNVEAIRKELSTLK